MKILILSGSPRINGNTEAMVRAFSEGARHAGHDVETIPAGRKKIAGCLGCEYCHTKGKGSCIQKDDEEEIYRALESAEMLVLASPVYYFTLSAQLQAALHRTYAVGIPKNVRQTALLLSSGAPGVYEPAIGQYRKAIVEYFSVKDAGVMVCDEMGNRVEDNLRALYDFGAKITE